MICGLFERIDNGKAVEVVKKMGTAVHQGGHVLEIRIQKVGERVLREYN